MNLRKWGISGVLVSLVFVMATVLFFSPNQHANWRPFFAPVERRILSVATGKIFPENKIGRVVKLATPKGITLEIYGPAEKYIEPLIDTVILGDRKDAYFQARGRAVNLALKDMDNDSIFEIIAPSSDASLIPHLNIFRYNRDSQKFEPYLE